MAGEGGPTGRIAEIAIALSLATDLGTGQPMEQGLRTCWLSMAVADALGLDEAERSCVYHTALLRFLGCTSNASDVAALAGGDDIAFNATMGAVLNAGTGEAMRFFVSHLGEGLPVGRRIGLVARALADPGADERSSTEHCEVAARLAARLGLDERVQHALAHAFERWDGKGSPDGLAGEDVPVAVRIVAACRDVETFSRRSGWVTTVEVLSRRRGHGYDPAVVDALRSDAPRWLDSIGDDPSAAVLALDTTGASTELDVALAAIADFVDLKSTWLRGHSTGVAPLVESAADAAGLPAADATALRRAALVHDVGRVGVPSGIWDHPGPLTAEQWERVRLHPYLTERVLHRCAVLSPYAALAGRHHERADGTGYQRGSTDLDLPARLLAAADAYHAMTEDRPHRAALDRCDAAVELRRDRDAGRFGAAEVDAVLEAAGHSPSPRPANHPAGLTDREVEVLRLIARGHANKQVATELGIAAKTVGSHIEHIYAKAGVRTRAGATLFAMEHGLVR